MWISFCFKKLLNFTRMKYALGLLAVVISTGLSAQPLRDINYNYLYNPGEAFTLDLNVTRKPDHWAIFYKLQLRDTSVNIQEFVIQWGSRESLSDKETTELSIEITESQKDRTSMAGRFNFSLETVPKILVAKVVRTNVKRAWVFYEMLEPQYPVTEYITVNTGIALKPYVNVSDKVLVEGQGDYTISFYNDAFPTASPPFAEVQAKVNRGMETDSTFRISGGQEIDFSTTGLYLVQKDTNATEGVAFRVENDYPRLGKIQSLVGPLVYICTKREHDRLVAAKGEKKNFDRVIIGITTDTDRARKFMRSYFRRVELANQYFTSYKEGWKTDRGMVYIIFGLPDEVFKFSDREVWRYDNDEFKVTFNFSKASSIFDPENYVLLREKKYQQTWYEVIDLWRNARF